MTSYTPFNVYSNESTDPFVAKMKQASSSGPIHTVRDLDDSKILGIYHAMTGTVVPAFAASTQEVEMPDYNPDEKVDAKLFALCKAVASIVQAPWCGAVECLRAAEVVRSFVFDAVNLKIADTTLAEAVAKVRCLRADAGLSRDEKKALIMMFEKTLECYVWWDRAVSSLRKTGDAARRGDGEGLQQALTLTRKVLKHAEVMITDPGAVMAWMRIQRGVEGWVRLEAYEKETLARAFELAMKGHAWAYCIATDTANSMPEYFEALEAAGEAERNAKGKSRRERERKEKRLARDESEREERKRKERQRNNDVVHGRDHYRERDPVLDSPRRNYRQRSYCFEPRADRE